MELKEMRELGMKAIRNREVANALTEVLIVTTNADMKLSEEDLDTLDKEMIWVARDKFSEKASAIEKKLRIDYEEEMGYPMAFTVDELVRTIDLIGKINGSEKK